MMKQIAIIDLFKMHFIKTMLGSQNLDFSRFGVPQKRIRNICVGIKSKYCKSVSLIKFDESQNEIATTKMVIGYFP